MQAHARRNGDVIHMPDGEEQENRDKEMASIAQTGIWHADAGPMLDAEFRNFLYGHNVVEHVSGFAFLSEYMLTEIRRREKC